MRDSRFIELLNLYVDQQLSKDDALELEREILRNPARAKMYQQYCRMQKACTLLFEQERNQAPNTGVLGRSLSDADRKVIAFPESRGTRWRSTSLYAASLAAAACVAFALVNRAEIAGYLHPRHDVGFASSAQKSPNPDILSASTKQNSPQLASTSTGLFMAKSSKAPIALASPARRSEYFAVFTSKPSSREENPGDLVLEGQSNDRNSYEWMRTIELAPVAPFTADQITLASTAGKSQSISLGDQSGNGRARESAAFEFQR